jgi:hypothetical protein
MAQLSSFPFESIGFQYLHGVRVPKYIQYQICEETTTNGKIICQQPRKLSLTFMSWVVLQCNESALATFLALPSLIAAPRDYDRKQAGHDPRGLYEIDKELLRLPMIVHQLDFPTDFRHELAEAHSETFLLKDNALTLSILEHKPLHHYKDPAKIATATMACDGKDPIKTELQPILQHIKRNKHAAIK